MLYNQKNLKPPQASGRPEGRYNKWRNYPKTVRILLVAGCTTLLYVFNPGAMADSGVVAAPKAGATPVFDNGAAGYSSLAGSGSSKKNPGEPDAFTRQLVSNLTQSLILHDQATEKKLTSIIDSLDMAAYAEALKDPEVQSAMRKLQPLAASPHIAQLQQSKQPEPGNNLLVAVVALEHTGMLEGVLKKPAFTPFISYGVSSPSQSQRLSDSLEKIDADHQAQTAKLQTNTLKPSPHSGLSVNAEGVLVEDDDELIDINTVQRVADVLVTYAQANGEDPQIAIDYLRETLSNHYQQHPPMSEQLVIEDAYGPGWPERYDTPVFYDIPAPADSPDPDGQLPPLDAPNNRPEAMSLYIVCGVSHPFTYRGYSCRRWPNDTVRYRFKSGLSRTFKKEVRDGMQDWRLKTGRSVSFKEIRGLDKVLGSHVMIGIQNFSDKDGEATIGYAWPDRMEMHIARHLVDNNDSEVVERLRATILHEVGHVLGLLHEHQRWDRSAYLDLEGRDSGNYKRIAKGRKYSFTWVKWTRKKVGFHFWSCKRKGWRIKCKRRYYWRWIKEPHSYVVSYERGGGKGSASFDCRSVMLYEKIKLKDGACLNHSTPSRKTKYNKQISSGDIAAVRRMY